MRAQYRLWFIAVSLVVLTLAGRSQEGPIFASGTWQVMGIKPHQPNFYLPGGIALGGRGNIFVADSGNFRVVKLAPDGRLLASIGSEGTGPGQFGVDQPPFRDGAARGPASVTVDRLGNLYVADTGNRRIAKFSPDGRFLAAWSVEGAGYAVKHLAVATGPRDTIVIAIAATAPCSQECPSYYIVQRRALNGTILAQWASVSPPPAPRDPVVDSFDAITHISLAVGPQGNVYIASNGVVVCYKSCPDWWLLDKRAPDGRLLKSWAGDSFTQSPPFLPAGVALDTHGNVYVVDQRTNGIVTLGPDGRLRARWSSSNWPRFAALTPTAVAADGHGNVYVVGEGDNRVLKLSPSGKVQAAWGAGSREPGQFQRPAGLAVDNRGTLYVNDAGNQRVQIFSPSGRLVSRFPVANIGPAITVDSTGNVYVSQRLNNHIAITRFSSRGKLLARWMPAYLGDHPSGLAVDARGAIYMLATFYFPFTPGTEVIIHTHLLVLDASGHQQSFAPVKTVFARSDIALDPGGNVYLIDTSLQKVVKISVSGQVLGGWSLGVPRDVGFLNHAGLAIDRQGNLYTTDGRHDVVREFSPMGALISQWSGSGAQAGQFHRPDGVAVGPRGTLYVADSGNQRVQKLIRG